MNIWEMLGIPPTEDIGKIKSAYAKQAKRYHPEEYPEEFKTLQNAYKMAMKLAKSKKAGIVLTYQPPGQQMETPEDTPQREAETASAEMPAEEPEEPVFDFSGVDAYGDREQFLRQFSLLAKNPYLRNRLGTWDYFLNQNGFSDLFSNAGFRKELVQTICGLYGWRRKTILYLEHFLTSFQKQENQPQDGQWETDCRAFRLKKLPKFRLPSFCMDRFFLKEGRNFHRHLKKRVSKMVGREIDLDVQLDLVRYIKFYLVYAEPYESYLDQLHKRWRYEQGMVFALCAGVCFFVVATGASFAQADREAKLQKEYLMQLYGTEAENATEEERKALRRDYNGYWRYAEEAIDDVLERYEDWEEQQSAP